MIPSPQTPSVPDSPVPGTAADPGAMRPYGAHLHMTWWRPIVIIVGLIAGMIILQLILVTAVIFVEVVGFGRDPEATALTPASMLAMNLSLAVMGPIALLVTAWLAKVPWRSLVSFPRAASWRRLGIYTGLFVPLVVVGIGVSYLIDPASLGTVAIGLSGSTVGLLVVALLTTPLQAAGEELMFRGAILPAAASWIRATRPALVLGVAISSILFGLVHFAADPWLIAYYAVFGLSMALMTVISRGVEAAIAFHVTNNVVNMVLGVVITGDGLEIDRSAGMGGPFMLAFIAVDLMAVGIVWAYERRARSRDTDRRDPSGDASHGHLTA